MFKLYKSNQIKMAKFTIRRFNLIFLLLIFTSSISFSLDGISNIRNINIAGLIVDAQTLSPLENAKIYDADNNLLGTTDQHGYFKIKINYVKLGSINFKLKIVKKGQKVLYDHENWSDFQNDTKNMMYFGLVNSKSKVQSFATIGDTSFIGKKLDYDCVIAGFDKIKKQHQFENQLAKAKVGNQKVFMQVAGQFYLVDDNGWIKLNTNTDTVFIDQKTKFPANQLNKIIKRKAVKSMTPLNAEGNKFAIYTR